MELRNYARILRDNLWIILPLTLAALTLGLYVAYNQPIQYQATSSYVAQLDTGTNSIGDNLYGLDTLTNRQSIFSTYCQVMTSQLVRQQAYERLGMNPTQQERDAFLVSCTVIPETNVLNLNVEGPIPAVTQALNQAIGILGMEKANTVYRFFGLQPLDPTAVKEITTTANRIQIGILGAIVGFMVSMGIALLLDYLRSPAARLEMSAIRDPNLGLYNQRYFQQRLTEELGRSRIRNRPLCLAYLRLKPSEDFALLPETARDTMVRTAANFLSDNVRSVDLVASLTPMTYSILMPETPADEARTALTDLHTKLRSVSFSADDYTTTFSANSGLVESSGGQVTIAEMAAKAGEALRSAEANGANTIQLIRTSPLPFNVDENSEPDMMGMTLQSGKNVFVDENLDRR